MNEVPPGQNDADEVDEHYRRASALDDSRPSELVRRRILQHAAQLATERTAQNSAARIPTRAVRTWRRPAIFGTLAAAALAGLLIVPQFLTPSAPPTAALPPALDSSSRGAAAPSAAMQSSKLARQESADALRSAAPEEFPAAAPAPAPALSEAPARPQYQEPAPPQSPVPPPLAEVQGALKPHAFARNAVSPAESTAEIAAKNAPAERQKMSSSGSAAAGGDSREEAKVVVDAQRMQGGISGTAQSVAPQPAAPMAQSARSSDPAAQMRRAAEIGDVAQVRMLLDKRAPIDARDDNGRTALMLAVLHGQSDAVDVLLAHGADPNAADAHGTTPLQAAIAADQQAIIAALQRAGAR
jgi:hypothetical protein